MKIKLISISLVMVFLVYPSYGNAFDDKERGLGYFTDRFLVTSQTFLFNNAVNKRINEIGNRIVLASGGSDKGYAFRVINDPTINAHSAAGGFVYINTGLLDILENEDELAAVIAHEIAHIRKSHHINRIYGAHKRAVAGKIISSIMMVGVIYGAAMSTAESSTPTSPSPYFEPLVNIGTVISDKIVFATTVSMIFGYERKQELEADRLAIQYAAKGGYDPNALIGVFKKLISIRNRLGITPQNYISSLINANPGLEERIKNAELILNPDKNKQMKEERKEK